VFRVGKALRRKVCFAAAALALVFVQASFGYKTSGEHWTYNRTVLMHLSLGGNIFLQDGSASFDQSAADALRIWNGYLAHMQFATRLGSSLPAQDSDSSNSVLFSSTVFGKAFGQNVLAVTLTSTRSSIIMETDVLFNSAVDWDSYRGPRQSAQDFHRVALHEFGHALGLDHPDDAGQKVTAIMNSLVSNIDALQADDISGAKSLYDNGPAYLSTQPSSNLVNLSTRGFVGTGEDVLIGGFIVQGSQPATVILRAIGRSLGADGIDAPLSDPQIELRNSNGVLIAQNDDWIDSPDAQTIASYHLDPSNSIESAILRTLNPGDYTAIVRAFDNGDGKLTGTSLVEVFDLHTTGGRAGNISTRGQVLTGNDVMIAGFIIGGSQPKEVVVRGLGPSLLDSGVAGALLDPRIELRNASGQLVASNDNWETDPNASRVRAFNLAPKRSVEAALDLNLNAGTYTVIMTGVNGITGVGLIEVYDASPKP